MIGLISKFQYGEEGFSRGSTAPVQRTVADGPKLALALLHERREECPGAVPILAVHDEIVVECEETEAGGVEAWLEKAMVDGMEEVNNAPDPRRFGVPVEGEEPGSSIPNRQGLEVQVLRVSSPQGVYPPIILPQLCSEFYSGPIGGGLGRNESLLRRRGRYSLRRDRAAYPCGCMWLGAYAGHTAAWLRISVRRR